MTKDYEKARDEAADSILSTVAFMADNHSLHSNELTREHLNQMFDAASEYWRNLGASEFDDLIKRIRNNLSYMMQKADTTRDREQFEHAYNQFQKLSAQLGVLRAELESSNENYKTLFDLRKKDSEEITALKEHLDTQNTEYEHLQKQLAEAQSKIENYFQLIGDDEPELSCPFIDGLLKRHPEIEPSLERIRTINTQLRYNLSTEREFRNDDTKKIIRLTEENARLKQENVILKDACLIKEALSAKPGGSNEL